MKRVTKIAFSVLLAICIMTTTGLAIFQAIFDEKEIESNISYLRANSLSAKSDKAEIVDSNGAELSATGPWLGGEKFENKNIKLNDADYVILQFDLRDTAVDGELRLCGKIPENAKVSIENEAGDYSILPREKEAPAQGVYFYGFGELNFVDEVKRIRVKIEAADELFLHSAAVVEGGAALPISETVTMYPFTESELTYANYYSAADQYYIDNNTTPAVFSNTGLAIYQVRIAADCTKLSYEYSGMSNPGHPFKFGIKDAQTGFTGDFSAYTPLENSTGEISGFENYTVVDPDQTPNSGDEYREVYLMLGEQCFLKYFSLMPYGQLKTDTTYLRTDRLDAVNEEKTAKVSATTGDVSAVNDPCVGNGQNNNVLLLNTNASVTMQFDLPDNATGGQIRLLGNIPASATVGIETPDGQYYDFSDYQFEHPDKGVYFYGFGNDNWLDEQKRIRIKVTTGTDGAILHSAAILNGPQAKPISNTVTIRPLSCEELMYAYYYGSHINYYFDQGVTPTLFTQDSLALYRVHVKVEYNQLIYSWDGMPNGASDLKIGARNANGEIDGNAGLYTPLTAKNGEISGFENYAVVDPDGIPDSGDEYREIQFMVYGGGFMKYLTLKPTKVVYNEPEENYITVPQNEKYAYFKTGSDKEADYVFVSKKDTTVTESNYMDHFNSTNSGMVIYAEKGGDAIKTNNARKIAENQTAIYEFDLDDAVTKAVLKLEGFNLAVQYSIDNGRTYGILNGTASPSGVGYYLFDLNENNALSALNPSKKIRIKITSAAKDAYLMAVGVQAEENKAISDSVILSMQSEDGLRYLTESNSSDTYYNFGIMPNMFLTGNAYNIYKINVVAEQAKIITTYNGSIRLSISRDGVNFTDAVAKSTPANGIHTTAITDIAGVGDVYIKVASGDGSALFVDNISVGIQGKDDSRLSLNTYSKEEVSYLASVAGGDITSGVFNGNIMDKCRAIGNGSSVTYKVDLPASVKGNKLYVVTSFLQGKYEVEAANNPDFRGAEKISGELTGKNKATLSSSMLLNNNQVLYIRITSKNDAALSPGNYLAYSNISIYADGSEPNQQPTMESNDYDTKFPPYKRPEPPKAPEYGPTEKGVDYFDENGNIIRSTTTK